MPLPTIALILGAVTCSALGQLLLKSGARHLAALPPLPFLVAASRDVCVLSGLAAWIASTVCWLYALRIAPLSKAYGLNSLTYLLILVASVCLFNEQVRPLHGVGAVLIIVGVACVLAAR
jgi:drug/metabolite transporter (DMT)-like permease